MAKVPHRLFSEYQTTHQTLGHWAIFHHGFQGAISRNSPLHNLRRTSLRLTSPPIGSVHRQRRQMEPNEYQIESPIDQSADSIGSVYIGSPY